MSAKSRALHPLFLEDASFVNERIREDYALNWLVDGLPAAEKKVDNRTSDVFYDMSFNLGVDDGDFYANPALNNHYEIPLEYHTPVPGSHRVVRVGFGRRGPCPLSVDLTRHLILLRSRGGDQTGEVSWDSHASPLLLDQDTSNAVTYTYRVVWNVSL